MTNKRWRLDYIQTRGTEKGVEMADRLTVAALIAEFKMDPSALPKLEALIQEAKALAGIV